VAIAGTAKNTGKTTTMATLLAEVQNIPSLTIGLTSIGYDGENFDNITGLPKPRIHLWQGCIVAVAEKCIARPTGESAHIKPLIHTDVVTPMGRIIVGKVAHDGKLVLAGPVGSNGLRTVLDAFTSLGVRLAIVDGALSRIAPMSEANGIVVAQGAAKNTDIPTLSLESKCLIDILSTPTLHPAGRCATISSILSDESYPALAKAWVCADTIQVNGVIAEAHLTRLAKEATAVFGKRLIFADSTKLLISGDAERTHTALQKLRGSGMLIGTAKPINPLAITVNPFYPKLRHNRHSYEPAYIDHEALLCGISSLTHIPCFNVSQHGGRELGSIILGEIT